MPSSRPRIVFSSEGYCNGCKTTFAKKEINWDDREKEFIELIARYKNKDGNYDCIVPWSGGKDSSYIAYILKFKYNLNPLLVTFSPLLPNDIGHYNRESLLDLGFNHINYRADPKVSRYLAKRFFTERGNPKVHWDAGINSVPMNVALKYNIPLVFYAEHGESEYGGKLLSEEHRKIRDIAEILENNVGDDPMNWVDDKINDNDLLPYLMPEAEEVDKIGMKAMYFGYFFPWDVQYNYEFIKDKIDFKLARNGKSDCTFTNYDSLDDKIDDVYYYMQYVKFGFGRASRDASRIIQRKNMTREEGLSLALKYDDEFPKTYYTDVLNFLGLEIPEFRDIVDKHRNDEIWKLQGNSWKLKYPPT